MSRTLHDGILFALLCVTCSTSAHAEVDVRTVSVSGTGKATATPDMATIRSGVATNAATAKEALAANNSAMAKILKLFKSKGIEDRDIQTSGFSVYPEYARQEPGKRRPNKIVSYRVSNQVQVRVRNLAGLGEIMDALVQAGSNQISGVTFGLSEPARITNEARKKAIGDARLRAELYAQASGMKVGKVIKISEQATVRPPSPVYGARMAMAEMASSVPVAAGEQEVSATIHVSYELVDQ